MRLALCLAALALPCSLPIQAAFTVISNPDASYLSSTTKLDFSGLANRANFTTVSAGGVTLTSSNTLNKRQVGVSWGTWSSPPNSESATPAVAYNSTQSDTLTLSPGVGLFGFEVEPNNFGTFTLTANYFNGATLLGTITRSVAGNSGARLAAASDTNITRVAVSMSGGSAGFAMAQFRYAPVAAVPEPAGVLMLLTSLGLVSRKLFRRSSAG
jgi:hypothetical protein